MSNTFFRRILRASVAIVLALLPLFLAGLAVVMVLP